MIHALMQMYILYLVRVILRARFFIHNSGMTMVGTECIRNINISVHSAPGSRMDKMAFCPFRNMNAE